MQFLRKKFSTRQRYALIIVTTGFLGTSLLSSCREKTASPSGEKGGGTVPTVNETSQTTPMLKEWTTKPEAVLVFSGDEHGYLEPCGCSERQSGGFARRADFMEQLKNRGWSVSAFDVGGILKQERVNYPQSKIKFRYMLRGLNQMGYQGLQLGLEELLLGVDTLFSENQNLAAEQGYDVPFLSENVTFYRTENLGVIGSRVVQVGEMKVGVVGMVGDSTVKSLLQTGTAIDENVLIIDPAEESLRSALEELKSEQTDLLVLLSHAEIDESEALAKKFPEFQIVVTANSAEDPRSKPEYVGETMIVQVGKKGKNVVAVGLFADQKLKHELVELDMDRFAIHPDMTELMKDYQEELKDQYSQLVNENLSIGHPTANSFAGAKTCAECHQYAYGIWSKTKHAHAIESLTKGRPGQESTWVDRAWDPECLACHTTGWDAQAALRFKTGFLDVDQSQHLAGNQCENCHGPAAEHVQLEEHWKTAGGAPTAELIDARKGLQLLKSEAEQKVCSKCHDYENSPKFNFETYWKEVSHSGRKN
ncbi:multiheme c-type cytochrome [Planctomicrobium sp.]|nr:multiheme c-type cytochrome [Planctomicrobium sp.]MDB4439369.1 multiheme c-type cytochrome [Planctomicrobium sp.]MDB4743370.1 multiheme c-type cytochrome [Planctomicrobium sp.]